MSNSPPQVSRLIHDDLDFFDCKFKISNNPPNLSQDETLALAELAANKQIVIKPVDKGSSIVIMDREQYLWEGNRQLSDRTYYVKLDRPIFHDTVPMVHTIIKSLFKKNYINLKQKSYLLGSSEPRPLLFYMLPKIHKEPETWPRPDLIPPG